MTTPKVDFDESPEPAKAPSGKNLAAQFAAVRARGVLNAGLDMMATDFKKANKEYDVRWEFYKPGMDGGLDMVTMREGMGWRIVDWSKMPNRTETSLATGPVRRGDLVLMYAPLEVAAAEKAQDAEAARADLKLPESAFKDNLEARQVRRSDGESDRAVGTGTIKVREEFVQPVRDKGAEGG